MANFSMLRPTSLPLSPRIATGTTRTPPPLLAPLPLQLLIVSSRKWCFKMGWFRFNVVPKKLLGTIGMWKWCAKCHLFRYVWVCVYVGGCMLVYVYVGLCVCGFVCMWVCVYVGLFVCEFVCVWVRVCGWTRANPIVTLILAYQTLSYFDPYLLQPIIYLIKPSLTNPYLFWSCRWMAKG